MILVLVAAVRNLRTVTEEMPKAKQYEAAQSLVILALRFFYRILFRGVFAPILNTRRD